MKKTTTTITTTTLENDMRELIAQGWTKKGYCYWTAVLEKNGETIILDRV